MPGRSLTSGDEALSCISRKFCEGEVKPGNGERQYPKAHWQAKARSVRIDVGSPEI
ncbi:hypothetical protein [Sphingobacterium kitahiroshimense]|uniref:Uncharacterized protein n=1 Tax=Sphingobacterium kitahiroshimense TaxID=470446 RepID=A0ABV0BP38_9SPHI